jgi:Domain of unknown function (DUF5658)
LDRIVRATRVFHSSELADLAPILCRDTKRLPRRLAQIFVRGWQRERAANDSAGRRASLRRRLERAEWLLLLLFVALEIDDVLTTNRVIRAHGTWEANPLMAAFQMRLGPLWWLPKAAMVAWVALAATQTRRRWPLIFAVTFCGFVIAVNLVSM